MTPEQREAAVAIIYWRHRRPRDHARWGIQQDLVTGNRAVVDCLNALQRKGSIPLYVVRGVEVRRDWQLCGSPITVWKDQRTGHWHHQPPPSASGGGNNPGIVMLKYGLTDEERAVLRRASGGITPTGEPPTSF